MAKRDLTYPHFLCIGAQKCGTTWLFKNLRDHPEICLDQIQGIKEINYFNTRNRSVWTLCRDPVWQDLARRRLTTEIFRRSLSQNRWLFRYLLFRRTDAWYSSLFRSCGDRLIGDVSPTYSTLDEKQVGHVASIMPSAKVILLLRNPIDRAWSHARMDMGNGRWPFADFKGRSIAEVPFDVLRQHLDNTASTLRGDYGRILHHWGCHFPERQWFIGFFEEIAASPVQLLHRLARFLGIEPEPVNAWPHARKRILAQAPMQMPPQVERYLSRRYIFDLRNLENTPQLRGSEFVRAWQRRAERHLA